MGKHGGDQGGRPTKLTPKIMQQLEQLIGHGNYKDVAAASVGINRDTLHEWLTRGARSTSTEPIPNEWELLKAWKAKDLNAKDDRIYRWFSDIISAAEANWEVNSNLFIQRVCLNSNDVAAAVLVDKRLQNRFPYRYKGIERVETTARVTVDDVTQLEDKDLDERLARYEKMAREVEEPEADNSDV